MNESDSARHAFMLHRLYELKTQKEITRERLEELDRKEGKLLAVYARAFPDQPPVRPTVPWEKLSYHEQLTLHFLQVRGGVRRLRSIVTAYTMAFGEVITFEVFWMRLSRLKDKGAVVHLFGGWEVAPVHSEVARKRPTPPPEPGRTAANPQVEKLLTRAEKLALKPRRGRLLRLKLPTEPEGEPVSNLERLGE